MLPITIMSRAQWGPESTDCLRLLGLRLLAAQRALEGLDSEADVRDVNDALADVDDLLAHLIGCWELNASAAQRIERVRDGLSSHLVAVSALAQAGMPAISLLWRAVQSTRTEVEAVLGTPVALTETM